MKKQALVLLCAVLVLCGCGVSAKDDVAPTNSIAPRVEKPSPSAVLFAQHQNLLTAAEMLPKIWKKQRWEVEGWTLHQPEILRETNGLVLQISLSQSASTLIHRSTSNSVAKLILQRLPHHEDRFWEFMGTNYVAVGLYESGELIARDVFDRSQARRY
jgi:hypothetical protein